MVVNFQDAAIHLSPQKYGWGLVSVPQPKTATACPWQENSVCKGCSVLKHFKKISKPMYRNMIMWARHLPPGEFFRQSLVVSIFRKNLLRFLLVVERQLLERLQHLLHLTHRRITQRLLALRLGLCLVTLPLGGCDQLLLVGQLLLQLLSHLRSAADLVILTAQLRCAFISGTGRWQRKPVKTVQ